MKTDTPKVLFEVCSKPMLSYVLGACRAVGIEKIYVVVGFGAELSSKSFSKSTTARPLQHLQQLFSMTLPVTAES